MENDSLFSDTDVVVLVEEWKRILFYCFSWLLSSTRLWLSESHTLNLHTVSSCLKNICFGWLIWQIKKGGSLISSVLWTPLFFSTCLSPWHHWHWMLQLQWKHSLRFISRNMLKMSNWDWIDDKVLCSIGQIFWEACLKGFGSHIQVYHEKNTLGKMISVMEKRTKRSWFWSSNFFTVIIIYVWTTKLSSRNFL